VAHKLGFYNTAAVYSLWLWWLSWNECCRTLYNDWWEKVSQTGRSQVRCLWKLFTLSLFLLRPHTFNRRLLYEQKHL